jgi:hypothetical protein
MTNAVIANQRLYNQHISANPFMQPVEVLDWLGAVQSQDFASAKWAVGLRLQTATDTSIEQAFNAGQILRTHVLRPTWHFVAPADIRWLLALSASRVHALNALYYRRLELEQHILCRSITAIVQALQGGRQLTREELQAALEQAGIAQATEMRLIYILMYAELEGIICSGARRGKQFTYALLDERAPLQSPLKPDEAAARLALRYFLSRGPASLQDFAKWSGLSMATCRTGLEAVKDQLQHELVDGQTYWCSGSVSFEESQPAPGAYLLSIFDEYICSYKDRSAMVAESYAKKLNSMGNALTAIMVVDGQIIGTWKRVLKKDMVLIKTDIFSAVGAAGELAMTQAMQRYAAFLELDLQPV